MSIKDSENEKCVFQIQNEEYIFVVTSVTKKKHIPYRKDIVENNLNVFLTMSFFGSYYYLLLLSFSD